MNLFVRRQNLCVLPMKIIDINRGAKKNHEDLIIMLLSLLMHLLAMPFLRAHILLMMEKSLFRMNTSFLSICDPDCTNEISIQKEHTSLQKRNNYLPLVTRSVP